MHVSSAINLLLPQRAATVQQLGHPAAGVIGWFDSASNASGVSVTENTALTFSAVWCAVRVIAETLATLPCVLYRKTSDDGRERATDDPRYSLVHDEPHPLMSAVTFFETQTAQMLLHGNCYAEITPGQNGEMALEIRDPEYVVPVLTGSQLTYEISDPYSVVQAPDMLHVAGLGGDGIQGWSVIKYAQQSIGSGMAGDTRAASQFGNGATPNGVLKFPMRLDRDAREKFRKDWNEQHQGSSKSGNIAILHGGMEFVPISMTNEDAQFLESRQFSVREIARWFRLPPHMLADLADSSVRANIEQQAMEFVVYSMAPWLIRWQQALNRKLLTREERQDMYFEFLLDALLRGDAQSRFAAYSVGRQWGWLSVNDIRRRENMNLIDGGDVYLQPSNMVPADSDLAKGERPEPSPPPGFGQPPEEDEEEDDEEEDSEEPETVKAELRKNFADSLNAILDHGKQLRIDILSGYSSVTDAMSAASSAVSESLRTLHDVRDEIRHDLAVPRAVQVRGSDVAIDSLTEACTILLHDHAKCCQRVERVEVLKAVKRSATRGENFLAWMDRWYGEFSSMFTQRIGDVVACYGKLVPVADTLAADIVAGYCQHHRQQLLDAADGSADGFADRAQQIMDGWQTDIDRLTLEK